MNSIIALFLCLFSLNLLAESTTEKTPPNLGQVCVNISGRGLNTDKTQETCKKGDIIQVDEKNMPFLCDFNFGIARYNFKNNYICVYLGERRPLREGSNF